MDEEAPHSSTLKPVWNPALFFAWLAGALVLQVPFQLHYRLGYGHFGYNIIISIALIVIGVILVVGLSHAFHALVRHPRQRVRLGHCSTGLFASAAISFLAAFAPGVPFAIYWVGVAALGIWLLAALALVGTSRKASSANCDPARSPLADKIPARRFNGIFWLLVFAIFMARDLWGLDLIDRRGAADTALLLLGRVLSLAAFVVGLMLLVHVMLILFPAGMRWIVITAASFVPLVLVADFAVELYWQQSLIDIINSLTLAGHVNVRQQLEAAGLHNSPLEVFAFFAVLTGLSTVSYLALHRISLRYSCHPRTTRALLGFGVLWLFAVGQQALSMVVLPREIWQAEHAAFKIHLGLLRPDPGEKTIPVQFAESQTDADRDALLAQDLPVLARKPDIYVLMVETWRADTITPEVAPFLTKFRDEECQPIHSTLAGSNCTPVSWFTFFHSRLGSHWKDAVAKHNSPGGLPGAYPLRLLQKLGYNITVRAVADLDYQEISGLNFGSERQLVSEYLDLPMLEQGLGIPEREIIVVDDLKNQLLNTPRGGHLHFLALESPHYNYYWPAEDFDPLHRDCAGNINFGSFRPTPEEIRRIVKRYENSINWIDHQLEEFVAFLKAHNRYDNSIIILTGDHGEEFQEHGSWFHCSNLKRPQTEVPILIKWPEWVDHQPPQKVASHLDVMPSVLDALGLDRKYFEGLAGSSILRAHPGEAFVATRWAGLTRVGFCFVKDDLKANFAAARLFGGAVPDKLYFMGFTDRDDQPLDPDKVCDGLTHVEALRKLFPDLTARCFTKFGLETNGAAE